MSLHFSCHGDSPFNFVLYFCRQRHIHHLAHLPLPAVAGHHHRPQARIVEGDGGCGRAVQPVQGHSVAPDGSPALHDHQRAAGDFRERGQGLGWGDGRGDGDGVDDGGGYFILLALAVVTGQRYTSSYLEDPLHLLVDLVSKIAIDLS